VEYGSVEEALYAPSDHRETFPTRVAAEVGMTEEELVQIIGERQEVPW